MESFLTRQYWVIFGVLMVGLVGLSFYVGMLEGKRSGSSAVVLSCSDELLSKRALSSLQAVANPEKNGATPGMSTAPQGAFAGSKNGTKYYTPGCAGLERIKPENIVWFQSAEDATLQGYTPASC